MSHTLSTVDDLLDKVLGKWCEKCQRVTQPYFSETNEWPCCNGCWHRYDYWTEHDGLRLKADEDIEVVRVDGRIPCPRCGKEARDHPSLGRWGGTFRVMCSGQVVKT